MLLFEDSISGVAGGCDPRFLSLFTFVFCINPGFAGGNGGPVDSDESSPNVP